MYAMTCAHREYPFGTQIRVTNVANDLSAECVVNDRGPFVEGRDIDLSYAMAKEIELIGRGTGRVMLEVSGRDNAYIRPVRIQTSERTGLFAIQVGSFAESLNAVQLKVALGLKYANVYVQEAELTGGTYYRVRVGNFDNYNAAMSVAKQLSEEGYPAILMKVDVRK